MLPLPTKKSQHNLYGCDGRKVAGFLETAVFFEVKYSMVGGVAVNLHGYSRTTEDIDMRIKNTVANRKEPGLVFEKFGYDDINLEDLQFIPG